MWNQIRHIPELLQVALCLATPKLVELAREAVADAPDPRALFEHFSFTAGIRTQGGGGIARLQQLQALQPYFQLLPDSDLIGVWDACIQRAWLDYAREHAAANLRSRDSELVKRALGRTTIDLSDLESDLNESRFWRTYRWLEDGMGGGARREELIAALFDW